MLKIAVHGFLGAMGSAIVDLINEEQNIEVVAGIDKNYNNGLYPFLTYNYIFDCTCEIDVIVDFSTSKAIPKLIEYALFVKKPLVICTTGLDDNINLMIDRASETIPIFKSSNMSLGINILGNLLKKVSNVLYNFDFDIEIIEKHHNKKIDAPSGTALYLYNIIKDNIKDEVHSVKDRSITNEKRTKSEIGLHAIRGGTIVGEHSILFSGEDETFELTHIAQSKKIFAIGAVKACKFIFKKSNGIYNMDDLLGDLL